MQFPSPVRAVVGLLANAADEARHLPDRAVELPMLAVSTALQVSLRAQQRYARLAARGDEVLSRRPASDEPPSWATFDDPVDDPAGVEQRRRSADEADEQARAASDLLDDLLGPLTAPNGGSPAEGGAPAPVAEITRAARPAGKPATRKAPAKKAAKPTATTSTATKPATSTASKAPAKKAAAKAPAKKSATGERGKSVSKPRHTAPSRFDAVDDE